MNDICAYLSEILGESVLSVVWRIRGNNSVVDSFDSLYHTISIVWNESDRRIIVKNYYLDMI